MPTIFVNSKYTITIANNRTVLKISKKQKQQLLRIAAGAPDETRTRTHLSAQGILSPSCLPFHHQGNDSGYVKPFRLANIAFLICILQALGEFAAAPGLIVKILFLNDAVPTLLQTSFAPILRPEEYILHLSASPLPRSIHLFQILPA